MKTVKVGDTVRSTRKSLEGRTFEVLKIITRDLEKLAGLLCTDTCDLQWHAVKDLEVVDISEYTVKWAIDLDAVDHMDAAKKALKIMRDPHSHATVFTVRSTHGVERDIDLCID